MATTLDAVILGLVQGLTEFLPVSSSAHLILVSEFVSGSGIPLYVNVGLHLGTLGAVFVYFWRDWWALVSGLGRWITPAGRSSIEGRSAILLAQGLVLGTLPAAVVGGLFKNWIEATFHRPWMTAFPLAFFGILIWWVDRRSPSGRGLHQLALREYLTIGLAQALALIPGVSRSGITILAGRALGLGRLEAARVSLMMGTPAMVGAGLLELDHLRGAMAHQEFVVGMLVALLAGMGAIRALLLLSARLGFGLFAVYRLGLAALIIYTSLA